MGKVLLSLAIAILLAVLTIANLPPESSIRQRFAPAERVTTELGLGQGWGVFIHPRLLASLQLEAEIYLKDGSVKTYEPRHFGRVLAAYRAARWRKLEEHALLAESFFTPDASRVFALWLADQHDHVEKVALFKVETPTPMPGGEPSTTRTEVYELSL